VSNTVRETVDAVTALKKKGEVSLGQLTTKLGLDKSVVSRRLRQAIELGYLVNRETRRGRPARLVLGDPMPEEMQVLPDPSELAA
jgi:predicted ArsR family transcriptional regulator